MKNTNLEAARIQARAAVNAARRRLAAHLMHHSGARLDAEATVIGEDIVFSGSVSEIGIAAAYFRGLGVAPVVDVPHADDPDWTCLRVNTPALASARARLERR